MNPLSKVKCDTWTRNLAYAIGLIVSDGSLSVDGRHINFTSKDLSLIMVFMECLGIKNKIGTKSSGSVKEKKYFQVQVGDINFYRFLNSIGIMSKKSKTIGKVNIPDEFFCDFLRGHFDGDGSSYSYWDPRWKSSFMFYTTFVSASAKHIEWLQQAIFHKLSISGHVTKSGNQACYQLKYAKNESLILIKNMYYKPQIPCLSRKLLKIQRVLSIINQHPNSNARVV